MSEKSNVWISGVWYLDGYCNPNFESLIKYTVPPFIWHANAFTGTDLQLACEQLTSVGIGQITAILPKTIGNLDKNIQILNGTVFEWSGLKV